MREIKFRVWDGNEMVYLSNMIYSPGGKFGQLIFTAMYPHLVMCQTDEIEPMQYTGLKDKNGKEIYEGDILRIYDEEYWDEEKQKFTKTEYVAVRYDDTGGCLVIDYDFGDYDTTTIGWALVEFSNSSTEVEVVGNIYDDKELLKGLNES